MPHRTLRSVLDVTGREVPERAPCMAVLRASPPLLGRPDYVEQTPPRMHRWIAELYIRQYHIFTLLAMCLSTPPPPSLIPIYTWVMGRWNPVRGRPPCVVGRMLCVLLVSGRWNDVPGRGMSAMTFSSMRASATPASHTHIYIYIYIYIYIMNMRTHIPSTRAIYTSAR